MLRTCRSDRTYVRKGKAMFETQNLIIRKSVWEDLDDFYRWELMPEVTEFFSIRDNQTREDVTRKFIEDDENPKAEQFTIMLKKGGEAVPAGRLILADIEEGWKAELWRIYIADTGLRGRGYGKEAMLFAMDYCFRKLKLKRLYLDHYTGNPAAHLYLSLGFQYEGILRKNCRKNGILYDVHLMSMLSGEYEKRYGAGEKICRCISD